MNNDLQQFRYKSETFIEEAVDSTIESKLKRYDKVHKMFGKFCNVDDLMDQINGRASLDHIDLLENNKVDKTEFRVAMK